MQPLGFLVRQATPADVGALVRMKMALAASCETALDQMRDSLRSSPSMKAQASV